MNLKNVLIFRTGHLGDTLVALPAYWAIRKALPDARLTLLSNANAGKQQYVLAQSVLPSDGLFDEWMTYPVETGKLAYLQKLTALMKQIRRGNFDAVFYLMTRNRIPKQVRRDLLFFRLCGVKKVFGTEYLLRNYLDPQSQPPLPKVETEAEYLLNCLRTDDFPVTEDKSSGDLRLTSDERSTAEKWLKQHCLPRAAGKRLVAVAPGSKWESKIWSEEKFYRLIEKLIAKESVFPIVFGGLEDREKGVRLIERWEIGANAAGELDLRTAAAAIAECRLYVGNDTGTMHLAAAVGTPCVGIFAAIDWENRWAPYGAGHQIIRKKVACEGCLSPVSLYDNQCLELIGVEEVYAACARTLSRAKEELRI